MDGKSWYVFQGRVQLSNYNRKYPGIWEPLPGFKHIFLFKWSSCDLFDPSTTPALDKLFFLKAKTDLHAFSQDQGRTLTDLHVFDLQMLIRACSPNPEERCWEADTKKKLHCRRTFLKKKKFYITKTFQLYTHKHSISDGLFRHKTPKRPRQKIPTKSQMTRELFSLR